jgi:hypothetical protein
MRVRLLAEDLDVGEIFLALEVLVERLEGQGGCPSQLSPAVYRWVSRSVKKTLVLISL